MKTYANEIRTALKIKKTTTKKGVDPNANKIKSLYAKKVRR